MTPNPTHETIYQAAQLYDWAFSFRNVPAQVDFILATYAKYASHMPARVVEFASGPGRHALELARRGARCQAMDISPSMVEYGRTLAHADGLDVQYVRADMTRTPASPPVDLALCMLCSATYLVRDEDMAAHFSVVAQSLVPGGVYFMEMPHPLDITETSTAGSEWTVVRDDGVLKVRWFHGRPDSGGSRGVIREEAVHHWIPHTGPELVVRDQGVQRAYELTTLEACLERNGGALKVRAVFGGFDANMALDHPKAWRTLLVLQKEMAQT